MHHSTLIAFLVTVSLAGAALAEEDKALSWFQQAESAEAKDPSLAAHDYARFLSTYSTRATTSSKGHLADSTVVDPKTGRKLTELAAERCAAFRAKRPWSAGSIDELERRLAAAIETGKVEKLGELMSPESFREVKAVGGDPGEPRKPAELVAWLRENAPPGVKLTVERQPNPDNFGCLRLFYIRGSNGILVTVEVCTVGGGLEWETYQAFEPNESGIHMIVE